jgi:hypothetical protein
MLQTAESLQEVKDTLWSHYPRVFCEKKSTIINNITEIFGTWVQPLYRLDQFNAPPLDLSLTVILSGPAACAKTSYALAHFERPLLVTDTDDLKNLSDKNDGVVLDDVDLTKWSTSQIIALIWCEYARSIRCRYANATIKAGTRMIFTTNLPCTSATDHIFNMGATQDQYNAVQRRYRLVTISGPLFDPPTPPPPLAII